MGKSGPSDGLKKGGKRPADNANADSNQAKKLLACNPFSLLPEDGGGMVEKKEKLPPFYVKGQPRDLLAKLNEQVRKGLRAEFRLCTDGVKITVASSDHYQSVAETLKIWKVEHFTHDIKSKKPLKVLIRGLYDVDVSELESELKHYNLQPLQVFKIQRHNQAVKCRDQLYLVHLVGGSTNMKELRDIRTLLSVVVEWERYKPSHRDVTQCSSCLNFGHGSRNCHMKARCAKCGDQHTSAQCIVDVTAKQPVCVNCGNAHTSTSRSCPKRAEFIARRKKASQPKQQKKQPEIDLDNGFPPLPPPRGRTANLPSGGLNTGDSAQTGSNNVPPGFWGSRPSPTPPAPSTDGMAQIIANLTSLVSDLQKMMVQMMHFMMNFNIRNQHP